MSAEKVERAKNAAARAALEAYASTLAELLEAQGLPLALVAAHGTRHVHRALLVDPGTGDTLAITTEWAFTVESEAVASAIKAGPHVGRG